MAAPFRGFLDVAYGSSVNFLGDGTIFWGDGTEFRTASVMLFIRLPEGPKKRNQVTHMF